MPQLDFITNVSFLQWFILLFLVGFIYLNDYLNGIVLSFSESVFNFFSQTPAFLGLLTSNSITLYWIAAQHARLAYPALKRVLTFNN